jgi:hypothetical protein
MHTMNRMADAVHAWFLRQVIKAYRFEQAIAINPRIRQGLSSTINRLEGDLHRLQIRL